MFRKPEVLYVFLLFIFFSFSCNQQEKSDNEYEDEEFENTESEEELVDADFKRLEHKMQEIMYENDTSGSKIKKDVVLIKSQGAQKVDIELKIAAGRLKLSGGASELLTGGFIYSNEKWKPNINYKVEDKKGFLVIKQPNNNNLTIDDDDKYTWNLKFNNELPLNFNVELGAGLSEIYLNDMHINRFRMVTGVGKTEVDLRGKWHQSCEIHLDGGIGLTQVYLPENVGVRLKIEKGIGGVEVKNLIKKSNSEYVNKESENADILLKIYLNTGIGKIEVK